MYNMKTLDKMELHKARQIELQRQQILREIAQKHELAVIRCLEAERLLNSKK